MARYGALLIMFAVTAVADEATADSASITTEAEAAPPLAIDATPYHATRWCILTFLANTRDRDQAVLTDFETREFRPLIKPPFAADHDSFVTRIQALRSARLMTLWQGRERALVIGLNRNGYVGISLDQAVARND